MAPRVANFFALGDSNAAVGSTRWGVPMYELFELGETVPLPFSYITEEAAAFSIAENYWNDWKGRYYHLEPLRAGAKRTQPLTAEEHLNPDGGNLAAVALFLQTHKPTVWKSIGGKFYSK